MSELKDLVKPGTQAIAKRESFIEKGDISGTEDIGLNDLRLPRLAIAQGLSPQLVEGDSSYIPNLKMFDLFNDLTGDVFGKGPVTFVPVRRDVRYIEFRPREDGGGVLEFDVPPSDERCQWSKDENGEKVPPKATRFVEFVILMLKGDAPPEPIVLSIKDTNKFNRRASERLTGFIKLAQKPIYAGRYTLSSKSEKNDNGTFGVPVVQRDGFLDDQSVTDEQWEQNKMLYEYAKMFADSLKGKNIIVEREPGVEDDFPTDE